MHVSRIALYAFAIAALSVFSIGQVAPTTTLSGVVTDPSGSAVPNAEATLVNISTQFTKHARTDDQGRFIFNLVPPGAYDLSVNAPGFGTFNRHGITLDVNVPQMFASTCLSRALRSK